jgi:hypothetical protein
MRIYINELSFVGQAKTLEEASNLLYSLAKVASETKNLRGDNTIQRHSDLLGKEILGDQSLAQLFQRIGVTDNPLVKHRIRFFLLEYGKGPFFDTDLNKNFPNHTCILVGNKKDVSGSCLAASVLSPSGGAVISAKNSADYKESSVSVSFKEEIEDDEKIKHVKNYCDTQSVKNDIWVYEKNPKHDPKTRKIKGKDWTHMDLLPETAQQILSRAIAYNKDVVYSKYKGQWYIFRRHDKNLYHGYPIKEEKVPISALKKWDEVDGNEGQIELL